MTSKQVDLTKNFFALGPDVLALRAEHGADAPLDRREVRQARPVIAEANKRALKAGYAFGETTEIFHTHYRVAPAHLPPGTYRNITGNEATALGFVAASRSCGPAAVLRLVPDHARPATSSTSCPATRTSGCRTFQAEDEIAAIGAAIGASYGGALGMTGTSPAPGSPSRARRWTSP